MGQFNAQIGGVPVTSGGDLNLLSAARYIGGKVIHVFNKHAHGTVNESLGTAPGGTIGFVSSDNSPQVSTRAAVEAATGTTTVAPEESGFGAWISKAVNGFRDMGTAISGFIHKIGEALGIVKPDDAASPAAQVTPSPPMP